MMAYNYLPFAKRMYLQVRAGTRQSVPRETFSTGMGRRTFLTDLAIDFVTLNKGTDYVYGGETARDDNPRCMIRLGVFGRPYMTEDLYPIALFNDKPSDEMAVWRFPKPYTIFPGERLKARVIYSPGGAVPPLPSVAFSGIYATWPSISFFGVRRDNNRPIVLYDTYPATFDGGGVFTDPPLGSPVILQGERLQCPNDTAVDIYAVKESLGVPLHSDPSGGQFPAVQIYSPDSRKWWENDNWPLILEPTFMIKDLRGPQWVLEPEEAIQLEVENLATWSWSGEFDRTWLVLTLRGQAEVEV